VGIEAGHRQARPRDAEARQPFRGDAHDLAQPIRRQQARHVGQWDVHGGERNLERRRPEEHDRVADTAQVREQIRVASPRQAGGREGRLVHRRRHDGGHPPGERVGHRALDGVERGAAGRGVHGPGGKRRHVGGCVRPVDDWIARGPHARVGRGLLADLRADAGRIACRNRDDGARHG
jgi:hypothetical protein